MLEKMRLHREASRKMPVINTVTDIAEHEIIGSRYFVHAEFVQRTASPGLRDSVGERAGVNLCTGDDPRVAGVLVDELLITALHV